MKGANRPGGESPRVGIAQVGAKRPGCESSKVRKDSKPLGTVSKHALSLGLIWVGLGLFFNDKFGPVVRLDYRTVSFNQLTTYLA